MYFSGHDLLYGIVVRVLRVSPGPRFQALSGKGHARRYHPDEGSWYGNHTEDEQQQEPEPNHAQLCEEMNRQTRINNLTLQAQEEAHRELHQPLDPYAVFSLIPGPDTEAEDSKLGGYTGGDNSAPSGITSNQSYADMGNNQYNLYQLYDRPATSYPAKILLILKFNTAFWWDQVLPVFPKLVLLLDLWRLLRR
jgi:hypothetical protein